MWERAKFKQDFFYLQVLYNQVLINLYQAKFTILVIVELLTRYTHLRGTLDSMCLQMNAHHHSVFTPHSNTNKCLVAQLARNPRTSFDSAAVHSLPPPKQTSIKSCSLSLLITSPLFLPWFTPQVELDGVLQLRECSVQITQLCYLRRRTRSYLTFPYSISPRTRRGCPPHRAAGK